MELFHLKLKRFVVANYRSVKRIELDHLDNMVWLAGRNNAGKSNLSGRLSVSVRRRHQFRARPGRARPRSGAGVAPEKTARQNGLFV